MVSSMFSRGPRYASRFILRRLIKFYANYWIIFLLFVPLSVFLFNRPLSMAYGDSPGLVLSLIKDFLGFQGFQSYNVTWWFNLLIILLYLSFPILFYCCKINVWLTLLLAFLGCAFYQEIGKDSFGSIVLLYALPFTLGISWDHLLEKMPRIERYFSSHRGLLLLLSLGLGILFILARDYRIVPKMTGARMDGLITCCIVLVVISLRSCATVLRSVMVFLGKHSANVYLLHTFFNVYWPTALIIHNQIANGLGKFLCLMTLSLLCSILIEKIKELSRYNKITSLLINRI